MHATNAMTHKRNEDLHECGCLSPCDEAPRERLNYHTGQFLAERDFRLEQDYHIGKHRQHNRRLHGYGVVCGLKVVPNDKCPDRVIIEPGLAIDCCGREVNVLEPVHVNLAERLVKLPDQPELDVEGTFLGVSICYRECVGELTPPLYSECGCGGDDALKPTRVFERFDVNVERFDFKHLPPWFKAPTPAGLRLNWSSTINMTRAIAAAVSPTGDRIFVAANSAAPAIHVFSTANGSMTGTIALDAGLGPALALDIAMNPDGRRLHALVLKPGTAPAPAAAFLRTFDIADLANVTATEVKIGDLPSTPGFESLPRVVAASSDLVYVIVPQLPTQQVSLFRLSNPTPVAISGLPAGQTPTSIGASADGRWIVIGSSAATGGAVSFVDTAVDAAKVEFDRPVNLKPIVLAVGNQATKLVLAEMQSGTVVPGAVDLATKQLTLAAAIPAAPSGERTIAVALSGNDKIAYVLTSDASNHGFLRAIDLAGDQPQVSSPHPTTSMPLDLVIGAGHVYVVGSGLRAETSGGVAVFDAEAADCKEILWRDLDGCPECDIECVPLAIIGPYRPGDTITTKQINNRVRPLLPSTNTLRDLIACCCGGHDEPAPPPPPPAPVAVTTRRLVALSWPQNQSAGLLNIAGIPQWLSDQGDLGIVVGFDGRIRYEYSPSATGSPLVKAPDASHVFQVMVRHEWLEKQSPWPQPSTASTHVTPAFRLIMRFPLAPVDLEFANVLPVTWTANAQGLITTATYDAASPTGLAYIFHRSLVGVVKGRELWVRLHGDFIHDTDGRPVDVDFARFSRIHPSDDSLQPPRYGGVFESWFRL